MDDKELEQRFASIGAVHGYKDVEAKFAAFKDFRVKWVRNFKWISFQISDYLVDASEDVIDALADTIFRKIAGEQVQYPDVICDWFSDKNFSERKQQLYVRRYTGLRNALSGKAKSLTDSYRRLVDRGLVEPDEGVYLGWIDSSSSRCAANSSVLMKVIAVSSLLDKDDVSDDLLDYCVYAQMANIKMGFNKRATGRNLEYDAMLSRYPGRSDLESQMRVMNLHL